MNVLRARARSLQAWITERVNVTKGKSGIGRQQTLDDFLRFGKATMKTRAGGHLPAEYDDAKDGLQRATRSLRSMLCDSEAVAEALSTSDGTHDFVKTLNDFAKAVLHMQAINELARVSQVFLHILKNTVLAWGNKRELSRMISDPDIHDRSIIADRKYQSTDRWNPGNLLSGNV